MIYAYLLFGVIFVATILMIISVMKDSKNSDIGKQDEKRWNDLLEALKTTSTKH